MTELEILRRRRELVLLSAELQRATLVRRLDRVQQHPLQVAFGVASSVVSIPLLWTIVPRLVRGLKSAAVLKAFPVPRFFNR